ncbi:uncharacterized protein AC631_05253 [Debaryomyces fabryi]|uniref:Uncharacterized protein n=1 Tax=Debaryomyces fabryi TaxID=58627 RepID=A0A0V1PS53_9ASCO|nr:uncharacterized protein AC631_05253 [Debaryomyces fabryi]KRZ98991.1 hypothetical protein AC631_05253 [Debaryomyces fabryi]
MKRACEFDDVESGRYREGAIQTWVAVGECSLALGLIMAAKQSFENAMKHDPLNSRALVGFASSLRMEDGKTKNRQQIKKGSGSREAADRLTMALEKYPHVTHTAEVMRELGECYLAMGMVEQAHLAVQRGLQAEETHIGLWLLNGQVLHQAGHGPQAIDGLRRCLSLLPRSLEKCSRDDINIARMAHTELATIATIDGNIEGAVAELVTALSLPPPLLENIDEHISLWCALATARERANDLVGALQTCKEAETVVGNSPRIMLIHSYLILSMDDSYAHTAIDLLETFVKSEGEHAQANDEGDFLPWYLMGKAYSKLDSPRAAYDSYQVAFRRAPKSPIPWLAIGKLYLQLNQLPDTLAAYSQALRLQVDEKSPATATAWDGLSCVYERSNGQLMDAADACNRAAACFRLAGDADSAHFFEDRTRQLQMAANREGPVPPLRDAPDVPNSLLRELVAMSPSERIAFVQGAEISHTNQPPLQNDNSPITQQQRLQTPTNGSVRTPQPHPQQPVAPQHYQVQQPYKQLHENSPRQNIAPPHQMWSPNQQPPQQRQYVPNIPPPSMANPNHYPHYFYQQPHTNGLPPGAIPARNPQMLQRSPLNNPQMIRNDLPQQMGPNMGPGQPPPPPPPGYAYGQYVPMQGTMPYPPPANNWGK